MSRKTIPPPQKEVSAPLALGTVIFMRQHAEALHAALNATAEALVNSEETEALFGKVLTEIQTIDAFFRTLT